MALNTPTRQGYLLSPPQHRLPRPSAPTSSCGSKVKACHTELWAFGSLGKWRDRSQETPSFLLIENPSTVTWKMCSEICDVIVQSGLGLEITQERKSRKTHHGVEINYSQVT